MVSTEQRVRRIEGRLAAVEAAMLATNETFMKMCRAVAAIAGGLGEGMVTQRVSIVDRDGVPRALLHAVGDRGRLDLLADGG